MPQLQRLLRRKARLTGAMRRRDLEHHARHVRRHGDHGRPFSPRRRTVHRARIHRVDLLLEPHGVFAAPAPGPSMWENGWLIGATRVPGLNAGYRAGRNLMLGGIVHITAGNASSGLIASKGLAHFLLGHPGQLELVQYGEIDSVQYGACEWNHVAFHVETEKDRVERATDDVQIRAFAHIARGAREYGVQPTGYHLGDHDVTPTVMPAPYVSHSSLAQRACARHNDWLPVEDMARVFALAVGATEGDDDDMGAFIKVDPSNPSNGSPGPDDAWTFLVDGAGMKTLVFDREHGKALMWAGVAKNNVDDPVLLRRDAIQHMPWHNPSDWPATGGLTSRSKHPKGLGV